MGGLCRRNVRRILKGQLGEFKKLCRKQSRHAVKVVWGYLEARRPWNKADKLLSQAEEAERILRRLGAGGVPIPDEVLATVVAEKEKCAVERAQLEEAVLSARDFKWRLPANLGFPDLEKIDFGAGTLFDDEGDGYAEESCKEREGDEEEDDEEEEEESEEDALPVTKGAAPGFQPDGEGPRPVPEEGGLGKEKEGGPVGKEPEAGGATHEAREETGGTQPAVDGATSEVLLEGGSVPLAPEGDGLAKVPREGEMTPPAAEGVVSGVQPGGGVQLEGETILPATEGATSEVPEGDGLERVQLDGDGTPPAREE